MSRPLPVRVAALGAALGLAALVCAPAARAEGPGYGGDAGNLAVAWVPAASVPESLPVIAPQTGGGAARGVSAVVHAGDPRLEPDGLALVVRGLGFRGKSAIEVRIGADQPLVTRADTAGALAVAVDPAKVDAAQPGVSVMAVGRNQSGTEVTLFGSIPPVADGSGPMTLVPWAVGAVALAGLALWARRRHARHHEA